MRFVLNVIIQFADYQGTSRRERWPALKRHFSARMGAADSSPRA
jgi:hypothetical protein